LIEQLIRKRDRIKGVGKQRKDDERPEENHWLGGCPHEEKAHEKHKRKQRDAQPGDIPGEKGHRIDQDRGNRCHQN
jgi:hypothetical protein